jgi:L-amino acid N-acyltransferase YncA
MVVRSAVATDAVAITSLLNALLATTTIEWTETPHTSDTILGWMEAHDTILVAEGRGRSWAWPPTDGSATP